MASEWISFWSVVAGGLIGTGSALGASFVGVWKERKAREDDRKFQREDRRIEQGRSAARKALTITSQFFTRAVTSGDAFHVLTDEQLREIRKIKALAELVENEDARVAIRSFVYAVQEANLFELGRVEVGGVHEPHGVYYRERSMLEQLRNTLGAYLRDEDESLASLRKAAEKEEASTREAALLLGYES